MLRHNVHVHDVHVHAHVRTRLTSLAASRTSFSVTAIRASNQKTSAHHARSFGRSLDEAVSSSPLGAACVRGQQPRIVFRLMTPMASRNCLVETFSAIINRTQNYRRKDSTRRNASSGQSTSARGKHQGPARPAISPRVTFRVNLRYSVNREYRMPPPPPPPPPPATRTLYTPRATHHAPHIPRANHVSHKLPPARSVGLGACARACCWLRWWLRWWP